MQRVEELLSLYSGLKRKKQKYEGPCNYIWLILSGFSVSVLLHSFYLNCNVCH